jgi:long-chain acyl-CoA synthetase
MSKPTVDWGLETVNEILAHVTSRGTREVFRFPDAAGTWQPITSEQLYGRIRALAAALESFGVRKGDRVALLSEDRWEWPVADFAILALGAVGVPLYPTNTAEQVGYMLRDSGSKVAIVSSAEQREKIAAAGALPELTHVIVMNPGEEGSAVSLESILRAAPGLQTPDETFDRRVLEARPEDLCTLIYTSGTTGEPKGVELTHHNLARNISVCMSQLPLEENGRYVEFLPLSHIYARHVDYALMEQGTVISHCAKFEQLPHAMKAIKPTFFVGVPRVFEKIRQGVEAKSAASPIKKRILAWAVATGGKHRQEILAGRKPSSLAWKLANKLVYSKILDAFGGCTSVFTSGSAALGMDTAGWFADVGIRILEGYGLTETSPVVSFNTPSAYRIGSIGRALPNMEVRLAPDGELEVRGPAVFPRYWNKPKETSEVFTEDGFFKTGDIAAIDADGFLFITDRKKEILKTSGGKMIAPQPIEGRLKSNALVGNAALVGDKHKFACVLLSPNFPALETWAKANGVAANDRVQLVTDQKVLAEYHRIVDEVNKGLAHFETMKRFKLVHDEWAIESGELTPSMKLKRRVVEKKYAAEIAEFYKDEATSREA